MDYRPTIAITMGDPAGIGPEVIVKALADPVLRHKARYLRDERAARLRGGPGRVRRLLVA
jgi:4-hydroxy-L-threonine phosphate dehydrogenase PdxA